MRFCFLTTFFPPKHFGGDAIFVANLANALASRGHAVEVVHCADTFQLLSKSVPESPFALHPDILVHTLHLGAASPLITYFTGHPGPKHPELARILAEPFDVVHWHNLSLIGGPGALDMGTGVRLCTLHDYFLLCPTHILFRYNREVCTERHCFRCLMAHRRPPQPWRWTEGWMRHLRSVDRFIAPSDFVRQRFAAAGIGIDPVVLPHFVESAGLSPPQGSRREGVLFAGRIEPAKGLQTILPLFAESGRRLTIAGAGSQLAALKQQYAGYPNIEFLGRVPYAQLAGYYAAAQATIIPSICYETFGLTILESLRQGTPVIASNFGALPELVAASGGGWVYHDLEELAALLDSLDREPELAQVKGAQGRSRMADFSAERHLAHYFALIEEVRSAKRGA